MAEEELKQTEIRDSAGYIAELEGMVHKDRQMRKIVGHEMRNRLNILQNFPLILIKNINRLQENQPITEEQKYNLLDYSETILRNVRQLESITTLLSLGSISHRDIKSQAQRINLEETVRNNTLSLEKELKKNNLGILYQYDRQNGEPISIHTHEGFMNAIASTIMFNLIKHAPKYSMSRQGIKINEQNLELVTENLVGISREGYGSQTGVGIYLLELAAQQLRGKLELYLPPSKETYEFQEIIGYKDAQELENHDTFGVKLTIPMSELAFHAPKKS